MVGIYECKAENVSCGMNFSGPRSCAGTSMASKMLFLILANLLQRFEFEKACDCDDTPANFRGTYDVTYSPLPYKIKIRMH